MSVILIHNIDTYRDGGTVGIQATIRWNDEKYPHTDEPTITIDYSISSKSSNIDGGWYLGWKDKGGVLIQNEALKDAVRYEIYQHLNRLMFLYDNKINNIDMESNNSV